MGGGISMRFMTTIRFKPKPECMDAFIAIYHEVTERALNDGSIESYFTGIVGDEIIYVGTFNEKESDANTLDRGLSWLGKYHHMLNKYPETEEYAQVEQGLICHESGS
tara:strand:+ start:796 stop:1119 length:324 start_codon:yes stop_codon:yes gene_type:complete